MKTAAAPLQIAFAWATLAAAACVTHIKRDVARRFNDHLKANHFLAVGGPAGAAPVESR
ncbi:MAG: hypothetical protein ACREFX_04195 [Opitutaceae bacterium]